MGPQLAPPRTISTRRAGTTLTNVSPPGKKAADIGCGGGLLLEGMARRGVEVTGIDMEAPAVPRIHS